MFYVENNEMVVICINAVIVFSGYLYIYAKYVGFTLKDMAFADFFLTSLSLLISGFFILGQRNNF